MKSATLLTATLALLVLFTPARAHAHVHLAASTPAQGDTVRIPLTEIRLQFSEVIAPQYTTVVLLDATGQEIALGELHATGAAAGREYVLKLDHALMAGAFTVKWKAAGSDAHATSGMFDFVVDVPEAIRNIQTTRAATATHPPEHASHHAAAADIPPMYRPETSLAWIFTRWLNFIGLMLLAGAVSFRFFVVERARSRLDELLTIDLDDAARRAAVFAALATLLSNALRLWLQSGSLHGPQRMWQGDLLSAMIFQTGWGKAWLAQTVAAAGVLLAALIKSRDRLESWFSAAAFAVIAASTPAFAGHAAAVQQMAIVPVLDDAVHVMAASAWLGTLALLLFAGLPVVVRTENGFAKAALLVNTFSPLALVMAGIAVFTGAMNAFVHINAVSELWTTPYGRILAVKVMIVLITATMGAYNWRVVKPRLGTEGATAHIRRSGFGELAVAVIIIFITAVLVGTPTN
ncbi:MAG TPA: copper resistance protein CopC [Longimicrobiales bacterium]